MGKQAKTLEIIAKARAILERYHPMTLRGIYYQLVSGQVIENNLSQYKALSKALVGARMGGVIPFEWIEDSTRVPRAALMWDDLSDYANTIRGAYRRDVWVTQDRLVEVWLEKATLARLFLGVLQPYGVTLNVGRGYDGLDSIHKAAERYKAWPGAVTVLYFGDFDPSGVDMLRSLQLRLKELGAEPEIIKCAIMRADIDIYHLPPNNTKVKDTRRAAFVKKWGDISVELDALSIDVMQERLRREVSERLDLDAIAEIQEQERTDRERIAATLDAAQW